MNPLADHPALRKAVYSVFWLVGLVLGALQVGFDFDWTVQALSVYAFLGAAVGYQAQANTDEVDDVVEL